MPLFFAIEAGNPRWPSSSVALRAQSCSLNLPTSKYIRAVPLVLVPESTASTFAALDVSSRGRGVGFSDSKPSSRDPPFWEASTGGAITPGNAADLEAPPTVMASPGRREEGFTSGDSAFKCVSSAATFCWGAAAFARAAGVAGAGLAAGLDAAGNCDAL